MFTNDNILTAADREFLAQDLVSKATILPSEQFGKLIMEVDHAKLGEGARNFRLFRRVPAVKVAEELNLSKCQVHFLENGKRQWNFFLLKDYLKAVDKLWKAGKTFKS